MNASILALAIIASQASGQCGPWGCGPGFVPQQQFGWGQPSWDGWQTDREFSHFYRQPFRIQRGPLQFTGSDGPSWGGPPWWGGSWGGGGWGRPPARPLPAYYNPRPRGLQFGVGISGGIRRGGCGPWGCP